MLSTKDISLLQKARKLISDGWCQNTFARSKNGSCVSVNNPNAVSFCAIGACLKVGAPYLISELKSPSEYIGISEYNDALGRSQKDILNIFDKAIDTNIKALKDRE